MRLSRWGLAAALALALAPSPARGQAAGTDSTAAKSESDIDAAESEAEVPRSVRVRWNDFDWKYSTFRFGGGILVDLAAYGQDDASKQQFTLEPDAGVRDFRLLFSGRFKTKRPLSWSIGYMYDGVENEWRFRQTGLMIGFPEAHGSLFIGRTKEGYSLVKVMTGYYGWAMERSPSLEFIPILADGVKWIGYFPKPRIFFNLGAFTDWLSEHEKFATYNHQVVLRVGWLPILSHDESELLHVAVMGRVGDPDEGSLQLRARPGLNLAPYFLDTGKFAAQQAATVGVEAYYRKGPWLYGAEYNWEQVDATSGERPTFHGGDAVVSWLITGETRGYKTVGAYFVGVSPAGSVFRGGRGAWEAVLHASYTDFDSLSLHGGKFWRITPMINWHLSEYTRLELAYGYGVLDRFGVQGTTHFFQARIQITL